MAETLGPVRVLLRSPDLSLPSRALTLSPDLTLRCLKLSLLLPQTLALDSLYFSLNGKPLPDSSTLASAAGGGGDGDVLDLTLRLRLRGGGGDGGATGAESRDCYLKMYATKKPDKVDPNETRLSRWTTCALSGEPLARPAVVDRLGNLFNKEALIEALLHKKLPKEFRHIRGLKDLVPIHLDPIPGAAAADAETRFQCPITGLEFNGKYSFFAVRGCGHVLSAKALKEVKSTSCLVCHREFSDSDKIVINGSAEEVELLRGMMEEERGRVKERKEKKAGACLSGTKHAADGKGDELENGKKGSNGKRFRALDIAPANATKEVYASIFTSSKKSDFKETYSCRSLPLGRN